MSLSIRERLMLEDAIERIAALEARLAEMEAPEDGEPQPKRKYTRRTVDAEPVAA